MNDKNYIKVRNRIPFLVSYCYIDCNKYIADKIFDNHDFPFIYFHKKELYNEITNFIIVRCTFFEKHEELFFECMEHLKRKLEFLDYNMEEYNTISALFSFITEKYEDLENEHS